MARKAITEKKEVKGIKKVSQKKILKPKKDIKALASWTSFISANDNTKIAISPYIQAPTAEGGAPRTYGGGNDTLGGVEEIIGREVTPFTGVIRKSPQNIIKAL